MIKSGYLYLVGLLALLSCENQNVDGFINSDSSTISLKAIVNEFEEKQAISNISRATDKSFVNGENVLVYVEKSGETPEHLSKAVFTQQDDGSMTSNPVIHFPQDESADIYSFYPSDITDDETLTESMNFSSAYTSISADQREGGQTPMTDVLFAAAKKQAATAKPVQLAYFHVFAKISVKLNPSSTAQVSAINIVGTKTGVSYQFSKKEGLKAVAQGDINPIAIDVKNDGYAEAFVCPQTISQGGNLIEFQTQSGPLYLTVQDSDLTLQAGKNYKFHVMVDKGVEVNPEDIKANIYTAQTYGRLTKNLFYDIKGGATVTETTAELLYGEEKMNGIRIPIYGNYDDNGNIIGHPSKGTVNEEDYSAVLTSVENAKRYNPDIKIFASKKLNGKNSFPKWTRNQSGNGYTGVNDANYAEMLMDFLRFMEGKGIEVDVLGIDNEPDFNEGQISASKFKNIVGILKTKISEEGLRMPQFIGSERYNPETYASGSFLYDLFNKHSGESSLDIYGTHYYPRHHYYSMNKKLKEEFDAIDEKGKEFWATEPHWDNEELAKADPLGHARMALCALWDYTDLGMDAFMWWGYPTGFSDLRANLMDDISNTIYGSQPIRMEDHDGVELMDSKDHTGKWTDARQKPNNDPVFDARLHTRAFIRNGNEVNVYFINVRYMEDISEGVSYDDYLVKLDAAIDGEVSYKQWTDSTPVSGVTGKATKINNDMFSVDLPLRSITKVTFKIK